MAVEQQVTRAYPTGNRFANETPQQVAQHREIARRHCRRRNDGANFLARLRLAELERFFAMYYGDKRLPDDDAGRADLRLVADHLAQIDPRLVRHWSLQWMPTLPGSELDALIADVGAGRRWKADAIAKELSLDDATRTRLKIRTIGAVDCGKAQRTTRRRRKRIAADRARRARAGARPHSQSAAATQPWLDEGISRRTWYRRRAKVGTDDTKSRPIVRSTSTVKNQSHEAQGKADLGREHGGETSTCIAKPLSSPLSRVRRSCDQGQVDQVAGLDDVAFRAAHREHWELLGKMPLNSEQKARVAELNEIIETERERRARRGLLVAEYRTRKRAK